MKIIFDQIKKYKTHLINEEKCKATIEKYIRDITVFYEWLSGRELTKELTLEYKVQIMENYAPTSVNSILASLNSFFDHNGWHEIKLKNLKIQRRIFCQSEKELTKVEYEKLLQAAKDKNNERIYLVMQTICATGIRVSELSYITAETVKCGQTQVKLKGKIRMIILNKDLCRMLKKYMQEQGITQGCVFVTRNGKPLDRHGIWKAMKDLCESAGVSKEKVFPHALRHLFAKTYYSLQKDIVRLADILGHSSINTTRLYTIENGDEHRRQMERLGLVCMRT